MKFAKRLSEKEEEVRGELWAKNGCDRERGGGKAKRRKAPTESLIIPSLLPRPLALLSFPD